MHRIHDWATNLGLSFSYNKCQLLQIGYIDLSVIYKLGSHTIYSSDSVNDLGVTIHSSLKPSARCINIANKANARSKLILKCFHSRSPSNLIRAFKTYVRPIVEYASPVWNPHLKYDVELIERVQRTFTRKDYVIM